MHFTTLYLLKGEELENVSLGEIEEDFSIRFCYCCGEQTPKYEWWCDWFQIGGRWTDILKAKKGIYGERSWCNTDKKTKKGSYSVVEIKDLTEDIDENEIYAIATKSRIYTNPENGYGSNEGNTSNRDMFHKLLNQINNKQINGVVALIDCHD